MAVYIINIILIVVWGILFTHKGKQGRKLICILCCIQWILISGLRAYSVGADTLTYKNAFLNVYYRSWGEIWDSIVNYIHGIDGIKDPGYPLFEKICQIFIGKNYTVFLLIIACMFTIPMSKWIYKYSNDPCISFLIFSSLFFSFFAITGHRQTIATSLVVFGGYACIKKSRWFPYILLHFIAFFIHKSSIVFLFFYVFKFVKINKPYWIISASFIVLSWIFRNQIMSVLGTFMGYDGYIEQYEGAGAYTFSLLLTLVYVAVIVLFHGFSKNEDIRMAVHGLTLAMLFTPLTFINPSAMRVVQYFSLFIMVLIPEIIRYFKGKERICVQCLCGAILIIHVLSGNFEYSFVFI